MTATLDLATWTPVRVSLRETTPILEWCYTGDARFDDPFFDQTIERCLHRPFSLLFRQATPIEEAERLVAGTPEPCGFVFHASRCGSTLLAQMLAALPDVHMLSEPPVVDTIVRARYTLPQLSRDQLASWVRTVVLALSRPGARSVFKFDSWTTVQLPVLRQAFPDVPWVFLYREPAEIIASQLRRRGAHMIPGVLPPGLFGLDTADAVNLPVEEYCARVLAAIFAAALRETEGNPGRSLVANYRRLPPFMPDEVAPLFSLDCPDGSRAALLDVATRDAKNPALPYDPGAAAPMSPEIAAAAERWAGSLYRRLEAIA